MNLDDRGIRNVACAIVFFPIIFGIFPGMLALIIEVALIVALHYCN